jgi:flagellar biosynthetic protein FliP
VKTKWIWAAVAAMLLVVPAAAWSQGIPMVNVTGSGKDAQYSLSLQLLALMTTLTLLPSLLLMMTSFVRIIIVMSILRQALGTGQTPPNNVLVGISLFLTLFIMSPVLTDVYTNAVVPYMENGMKFDKALAAAEAPLRSFMAMLSPMMISMPFKLMLFVLVDGWSLIMGSLAASFVQ